MEIVTKQRGIIQIFLQYFGQWKLASHWFINAGYGYSDRVFIEFFSEIFNQHTLCIRFATLEFFCFRFCAWGVSVFSKLKLLISVFQFDLFFEEYLCCISSVMPSIRERLVVDIRYMIFEEINNFFWSYQRRSTRRSNRGK